MFFNLIQNAQSALLCIIITASSDAWADRSESLHASAFISPTLPCFNRKMWRWDQQNLSWLYMVFGSRLAVPSWLSPSPWRCFTAGQPPSLTGLPSGKRRCECLCSWNGAWRPLEALRRRTAATSSPFVFQVRGEDASVMGELNDKWLFVLFVCANPLFSLFLWRTLELLKLCVLFNLL